MAMIKSVSCIAICLLLVVVCSSFAQVEVIDMEALQSFIFRLVEKVKSDDAEVRNQSADMLSQMTQDFVKLISAEAKIGDQEVKKSLIKIMENATTLLKGRLFLLRMDEESQSKVEELAREMPDLYDRIGDIDREKRRELVDELTKKGDKRAVPILIGFLNDDCLQVRKYAVKGLGEMGDPSAISPLVEMFKSLPSSNYSYEDRLIAEETYNITELVINALGQLKAREATPAFVKVIGSGRYYGGSEALMKALGDIGDPRAMPSLVDTLDNKDYMFSTSMGGRTYTLNFCDMALEALLKITDQPYSDYGMLEPGEIGGYGGGSRVLFESDEARNEGISKFRDWWAKNSNRYVSDEAAQEFETLVEAQEVKSLSMMPFSAGPQNKLRSYAEKGDLDSLLKEAKKAIKANPLNRMMIRYELISGFEQHNKLDQLAESFQEDLKSEPRDIAAYEVLGETYSRSGNSEKALEMYEKAEILDPENSDIQTNLGYSYQSQRMYEKALQSLQKAMKTDPGRAYLYLSIANVYVSMGKPDEALKTADELKKRMKDPRYASNAAYTYTTLGDIYMTVSHYEEAIDAYKKGLELESFNAEYFKERLANAYERTGDTELAQKMRREADPGSELVGKDAFDFTLNDLSGESVKLSNFKGKVVMLDFWATWCGPCVSAIPYIEALHKKYKDQGLVVIGINSEEDHNAVKNFARDRISYTVLLDAREESRKYAVRAIPTVFYIDKMGKIRYRELGYGPGKEKDMEQKIKELLEEEGG